MEGNIENLPSVLTGGCTIDSEDVAELWHIGITAVDDNDPMEDNIPSFGAPVTKGELYDGQVLVDYGVDPRKAANNHRSSLKIPSVITSIINNITPLDYLLILFPMYYVNGTMLPGINWRMPEGDPHVSWNEFIKWFEMWFVKG